MPRREARFIPESQVAADASEISKAPLAYFFSKSKGKTIAIPWPILDLPATPNNLKFWLPYFAAEVYLLEEMGNPDVELCFSGAAKPELTYQTNLNGVKVRISSRWTKLKQRSEP